MLFINREQSAASSALKPPVCSFISLLRLFHSCFTFPPLRAHLHALTCARVQTCPVVLCSHQPDTELIESHFYVSRIPSTVQSCPTVSPQRSCPTAEITRRFLGGGNWGHLNWWAFSRYLNMGSALNGTRWKFAPPQVAHSHLLAFHLRPRFSSLPPQLMSLAAGKRTRLPGRKSERVHLNCRGEVVVTRVRKG